MRTLLLALLAALAAAAPAAAQSTMTICHATGAASVPYVTATVPAGDPLGHDAHAGDLIPAPPGGCPATVQYELPHAAPTPAPADGTTICHATANGLVTLTVTAQGLAEHRAHPGDLIPAPAAGCPAEKTPASVPATSGQAPGGGGALPSRANRSGAAARRTAAVRHPGAGTLPMTGAEGDALVLLAGAGLILVGAGGLLLVPAPRVRRS